MESDKFYNELASYTKSNDVDGANAIIMNELGILLVKDRENFIELLNQSGINANDAMSDVDLIQLFINNIHEMSHLATGLGLCSSFTIFW